MARICGVPCSKELMVVTVTGSQVRPPSVLLSRPALVPAQKVVAACAAIPKVSSNRTCFRIPKYFPINSSARDLPAIIAVIDAGPSGFRRSSLGESVDFQSPCVPPSKQLKHLRLDPGVPIGSRRIVLATSQAALSEQVRAQAAPDQARPARRIDMLFVAGVVVALGAVLAGIHAAGISVGYF